MEYNVNRDLEEPFIYNRESDDAECGVNRDFDYDVEFDVELAKSGKTVTVPADRSILEAVRDSGIPTVSSCESGTCGTCKTRLLSGDVDHRDMVLMDDEKDDYIMICISRAGSGNLVIDL